MKVALGHPVELPCVAWGDPPPFVSWSRDGARYPAAADGSLALSSVGLADQGTYTCLASSSAGSAEARVQLLVQGGSSHSGWYGRSSAWRTRNSLKEPFRGTLL